MVYAGSIPASPYEIKQSFAFGRRIVATSFVSARVAILDKAQYPSACAPGTRLRPAFANAHYGLRLNTKLPSVARPAYRLKTRSRICSMFELAQMCGYHIHGYLILSCDGGYSR